MKNLLIVLFLLTFAIAQAADKKVDSKIESVTVFQNGAQIYRSASSSLHKGHQIIILSGLSTDINSSSIQVNGSGDFTIMSVTHQINYLQEIIKEKRIVAISDSLKDLNYKVQYQQQIIAAYSEEVDLLKANKDLKGANSNLSITELKTAADYYRMRFREIYTDRLKINEKIKEMQVEIRKLQATLNQLSQRRAPVGIGEILVEIDAAVATKANFNFDYLVNSAGWSPIYDIRAINVNKPVELHYRANIYQRTGIDWNNVKLSVSTGNPRQNGVIPILNVWYLNFYNQNTRSKSLANYTSNQLSESEMQLDEVQVQGAQVASYNKKASNASNYTTVNQGQTNTIFEIALPYSIPSSNKQVNVKVQKWDLPASYRYYAVPRLDPDAYLQARITGWEDLSLLGGDVNIFFEGTYVGQSYLNPTILSDTLDISLGKDKNIVIKRKKIKDKNSSAILGSTKKMNIAWSIEVKNNKSDAIHLVIEDQIPLSNRKDVEVILGDKSGASLNDKTGFLTWDFMLDSKKGKDFDFNYSIKYPKEVVISNAW